MAILADHTNIPSPFSRLKGLLKRCFSPEYRRPRLYLGDHSISYSTQDFVWSKMADEICREELDISATEILSIMSDGLPDNTALILSIRKNVNGLFHLDYTLRDIYRSMDIARDSRTFSQEQKKLYPGRFHVDPLFHRQGVGRILMFNLLRLGRQLGLESFNAYASDENGMLTWPKMGFKLETEEDSELFVDYCDYAFGFFAPFLDEETHRLYKDRLDGLDPKDPYSVWDVVSMKAPLNATDSDIERAIRQLAFCESGYPEESIGIKKQAKTFAEVLLYCESYDCVFDFNDPAQIAKLEEYCGRCFKTGNRIEKPAKQTGYVPITRFPV
ncbi:MAG: hypothetical protein CMH32_03765 [Micavibrio sp.]|nr:hypothetical protein [Micavibrio sp.]|tara:strand:+ start:607 stop:1593 length:987 start_codon:yes stop_codon:yes gene_type:complete